MEGKLVTNPRLVSVRTSPTEIVMAEGPFSNTYINLSFEAMDRCDRVQRVLERRAKEPASVEEIRRELEEAGCAPDEVDAILKSPVFVPAARASLPWVARRSPHVGGQVRELVIVSDGLSVGRALKQGFEACSVTFQEVPLSEWPASLRQVGAGDRETVVVGAFDHWRPRLLEDLERACRQRKLGFIPVYVAGEGAVIGPYSREGLAGHRSFERQIEASMTSWLAYRAIRDRSWNENGRLPAEAAPILPFAWLTASLACILVTHVVFDDDEVLANRAVTIDFETLFIDGIRVYRNPAETDLILAREEY